MQKSQYAFTLIELMVVVILLGIIAAFGIPNFSKMQERVDEKDGAYNLGTIASAMEMYRVRNEGYPVGSGGLNFINAELSLGIIEQNMVYNCTSTNLPAPGPGTFLCDALSTYGWLLDISESDGGVPRCASVTPCPVCLAGGCPATF